MLNMIKMDVYRMFRTKSMYVIWIILLASALLTSFLSKIDYDAVNKEWEIRAGSRKSDRYRWSDS